MPSTANLDLVINLKDRATGPLGKFSGALGAAGKLATGLALGGLAVATGAVAGLGAALIGGVGDARNANIILAQTNAVLESTGGVSGKTAEQISELAASLSDAAGQSRFGDDLIQQSTNLLLTFTNIKGDMVDQATAMSVDMAQALGGAPADAAVQLGKALNDPIAGISALSRVGVTFSEDQKAVIKSLMDTGDIAGAQAVIIAELNKEFGGSAAAAAAAAGPLETFKARFGEIAESVGGQFLPIMDRVGATLNSPAVLGAIEGVASSLATGIGTAITWLTDTGIPALITGWQTIQPAIAAVSDVITGTVIPAFQSIASWVTQNIDLLTTIGTTVGVVVTAFTAIGAVVGVVTSVATAIAGMGTAFTLAGGGIAGVIAILGGPLTVALGAIALAVGGLYLAWTTNFGGIQEKTAAVIGWLQGTAWPWLTEAFNTVAAVVLPALQAAFDVAWPAIQAAVGAAYDFISGTVWPGLQTAFGWLADTALPALQGAFEIAWPQIKTAVSTVYEWLTGTFIPGVQTAFNNAKQYVADLKTTWDTNFNQIKTYIEALKTVWDTNVAQIKTGIDNAKQYVADLKTTWDTNISQIKGFIESVKTAWDTAVAGVNLAINLAKDYVGSFASTVSTKIDEAVGFFSGLPGRITSAIGDLSGLLVQAGKDVLAGMANGVQSGVGDLISTVTGAIGDAIQAAKDFLRSQSPSRRTRDELGKPIMQGVVEGVIDEAPRLMEVMDKTIRSVVETGVRAVEREAPTLHRAVSTVVNDTLAEWQRLRDAEWADLQAVGVAEAGRPDREGPAQRRGAMEAVVEEVRRNAERVTDATRRMMTETAETIRHARPELHRATQEATTDLPQRMRDVITEPTRRAMTETADVIKGSRPQLQQAADEALSDVAGRMDVGIVKPAREAMEEVGRILAEGPKWGGGPEHRKGEAGAETGGGGGDSPGALAGVAYVTDYKNTMWRLMPDLLSHITEYWHFVRGDGFAPAYKAVEEQAYLSGLSTVVSLGNGLVADLSPITNAGSAMASALLAGWGTPVLPAPMMGGSSLPSSPIPSGPGSVRSGDKYGAMSTSSSGTYVDKQVNLYVSRPMNVDSEIASLDAWATAGAV